ncbi:hypothetical protein AWB66_06008 [Caballeronia telluris]|uniref:Uncharacterized protein n=1 Tax=Caballeronia telluris TaxID=326475 RepID=A0A158KEM1_9BURK|nr:hypothetical protein AWB66_06008 [Caballeronia telluris]
MERSLFHEPWWLDITTGGEWAHAVVKDGHEIVAETPYALFRKGLWRISTQPPLTRTLGPVIKPAKAPSEQEWGDRIEIGSELISKLPKCALVQQTLDTSIAEAVAFALQGFTISATFTLKVPPGRGDRDVWTGMRANTRNVIRRANERLSALEMNNANEFVDFYDANLARRRRDNAYGSSLMRQLLGEVVRRKAGMLLGAYEKAPRATGIDARGARGDFPLPVVRIIDSVDSGQAGTRSFHYNSRVAAQRRPPRLPSKPGGCDRLGAGSSAEGLQAIEKPDAGASCRSKAEAAVVS